MTIDERLQFLLQSTESLHQTAQEQSGSIQELKSSVQELKGTVQELVRAVTADGEHIRALVRVAELHDRRLSALEGGAADEGNGG